jgi:bacteriocin-like protein
MKNVSLENLFKEQFEELSEESLSNVYGGTYSQAMYQLSAIAEMAGQMYGSYATAKYNAIGKIR